jgi:hypothetical protein
MPTLAMPKVITNSQKVGFRSACARVQDLSAGALVTRDGADVALIDDDDSVGELSGSPWRRLFSFPSAGAAPGRFLV